MSWLQALMPTDDRFFELFAAHSRTILAGATELRALLDGGDQVSRHCKSILEHEAAADAITRAPPDPGHDAGRVPPRPVINKRCVVLLQYGNNAPDDARLAARTLSGAHCPSRRHDCLHIYQAEPDSRTEAAL